MSGWPLDFVAVDELVAALKAGGIRSVSVDPADINPPGVLVKVTGVDLDLLAGLTITTELLCVVPDNGQRRSMTALAALFNQVTTVVDPTAATRVVSVLLLENQAPLPGLSVPFDLPYNTPEESP